MIVRRCGVEPGPHARSGALCAGGPQRAEPAHRAPVEASQRDVRAEEGRESQAVTAACSRVAARSLMPPRIAT